MAEVQLNVPSQFAKITKEKITKNKFNLVPGLIILHYVYVYGITDEIKFEN